MQIPLQISFHGMEPSPAIEARIREKAAKLERFHDRIVGCKVVIEAPHRHHHKGKLYNVRIDISVPGRTSSSVIPARRTMPTRILMLRSATLSTRQTGCSRTMSG